MKILHSIRSVDPRHGGPIEGVKLLAECHFREGRQVEVVCLDAPGDACVREFPFTVHALGPVRTKYGYTPRLTRWLEAHRADYDAVIVNGLWQFNGWAVWRILRGSSTPYYVFPHGMLDPWFKRAYPLKHLKKWLYWPWAEYRVLRDARTVFFTSEQERALARRSFRLYHCRQAVVGYGTRTPTGQPERQREEFLKSFPQCAGKRLWLYLGRIHEKKGCDLLLKAFAATAGRHQDMVLMIAGPDQTGWQCHLERLAASVGIAPRVVWPGMLKGDLKWGALHAAEVFVLPSHQENFGIAVAEALSCGLPVLISNRVNIWQEVQATEAGLVASDDLAGTQELCWRWLRLPETARQTMRANARRCFHAHFEIEQVAQRLMRWLEGDQPHFVEVLKRESVAA